MTTRGCSAAGTVSAFGDLVRQAINLGDLVRQAIKR
jgi:hypothetical protein